MTVIAWDGTTLAADKLSNNNGYGSSTIKIHRVGDYLTAFTGIHAQGMEMLEWFRQGADPTKFPPLQRNADDYSSLITISRNGTIFRYERSPQPIMLFDRQYAAGAGRDFALMAMRLGQNARTAVLLTNELCLDCGKGVDVLSF